MTPNKFENDYQTTLWHNPTEKDMVVKLWRGPENAPKQSKWIIFRIGSKETKPFPSEYDDAIQTVSPQGEVMGGKAPNLIKNPVMKKEDTAASAATSPSQGTLNKATK